MLNVLVVLYVAFVYIRPAEVIPSLAGLPLVEVLFGVSFVAVLVSLSLQPRSIWSEPQDWLVLAFCAIAAASNIAWGWFYGGYVALIGLAPSVFCYFLIRAGVRSEAQFVVLLHAIVVFTLFQACAGILQFYTGLGFGGVTVLDRGVSAGAEGRVLVQQIRGTGILNDPNDLALVLVIAVPFALRPLLTSGSRIAGRAMSVALLGPLLTALYYTNSRGGMLGLAAVLCTALWRRSGRVVGSTLVVLTLAGLAAFGPSRLNELDVNEESAQGRFESWSEGLQMFKSRPLLGVGFGRYTEFHDLVAHNSFVHTLAELGIVGALCFAGMGYWFFLPLQSSPVLLPDRTSALSTWREALLQSGVAFVVCLLFLSRQYNIVLFIWLSLSSCYRSLSGSPIGEATPSVARHIYRIATTTVLGIIATYVAVRVLARWS